MPRYEVVQAAILAQLEAYRDQIEDPCLERFTLVVKFKPYKNGPPRQVEVSTLNQYEGVVKA